VRYELQIVPSAQKEIAALPTSVRRRVDEHIRALADDPRPKGALPMKGKKKGLYRLRVGDYRIVYQVRDKVLVVVVVKVGHRGHVYR